MSIHENYEQALLHLTYLLIWSDSEISDKEMQYLDDIKQTEGISDSIFKQFNDSVIGKNGREIYQTGIKMVNNCSAEFKIRAFVKLFQLANADGVFHVKEVRLLLYAAKLADLDFEHIMTEVKKEACLV
jgi:uncharacterized tellurite resistance protein B-like protein